MNNTRSGQSLIEIMIAVAVMVVGIAASALILIVTAKSVEQMTRETQAAALAEEGIEAAVSIRDRSWDDLALGAHGLGISASPVRWDFQGGSDSIDGFTRTVTVISVDINTKRIVVIVNWNPEPNRTASVEEQILVTNWPYL